MHELNCKNAGSDRSLRAKGNSFRTWKTAIGSGLMMMIFAGAQPACAGTAVYTNELDFLAAMGTLPVFLNDFTNFDYLGQLVHSIHASQGGISYSIFSQPPLHAVAFDGAVSTINTNDRIVVTFTSTNVTAVGGLFFASDTNATPVSGSVTLSLSDGTQIQVGSSQGAPAPFAGFVSDGPLIEFLTLTNGTSDAYPALSHLYVAGPPALSIALKGSAGLLISWSAKPTGYVLQAVSDLPGSNWTDVSVQPQTVSNQLQVIVPGTGTAGFYRVRKP
jgi:hypothetical protein